MEMTRTDETGIGEIMLPDVGDIPGLDDELAAAALAWLAQPQAAEAGAAWVVFGASDSYYDDNVIQGAQTWLGASRADGSQIDEDGLDGIPGTRSLERRGRAILEPLKKGWGGEGESASIAITPGIAVLMTGTAEARTEATAIRFLGTPEGGPRERPSRLAPLPARSRFDLPDEAAAALRAACQGLAHGETAILWAPDGSAAWQATTATSRAPGLGVLALAPALAERHGELKSNKENGMLVARLDDGTLAVLGGTFEDDGESRPVVLGLAREAAA